MSLEKKSKEYLKRDNKPKNNFSLFVAIYAFLIVAIKWSITFYIFPNENHLNKIIFEIPDIYYFPYLLNILEFNFSPDYLDIYKSDSLIPIPFYSIFIHTIFYQIFNIYGFLIIEFFSLILFFLIFFNIFQKINLNNFLSFSLIMVIFLLPLIFEDISKHISNEINLSVISNLYSFRFPRPIITSLYFFWGLYLAIKYSLKEKNDIKDYILIGVCLSLCFVSYYYHFINLVILFFIIFLKKYFSNKKFLIENIKYLLISIIFFIILSLPFLILLHLSENDYSLMIGVIDLDFEKKFQLIYYLSGKIISAKFLFTFLIVTLLFLYLFKQKNKFNNQALLIVYLFFVASIISPFIFLILSPAVSEISNFLNWIVINAILAFLVFITVFINLLLDKLNFRKILNFKILRFIPTFLMVIFFLYFQINHYDQSKKKQNDNFRYELAKLQNLYEKKNLVLDNILSFIPEVQIWWMLNGKKKFTTIDAAFTSLKFNQLEKSFIENLKFLKFSDDQFKKIISNKKTSWRYDNKYIKYFSWYKYQANSLVTYQNTNDFKEIELKYILKSSPTKGMQIIIPKFEMERLINLYENHQTKISFKKPDIIVMKNNSQISEFSSINELIYCQLNEYKFLNVYIKKNDNNCNF